MTMIEKLEQRKKELRSEIRSIEERLGDRVRSVGGFVNCIMPLEAIRRFPLRSVAVTLAAGFLAGWGRIGGERRRGGFRNLMRFGLSGFLFAELKRMATRKAVRYASDLADQKLRQTLRMDHSGKESERA